MRSLFMDTGLESGLAEAGGAGAGAGAGALAWRLWAALEGGALALLAAALLAHARRARAPDPPPPPVAPARARPCDTVLITNSESELGKELKRRLEAQGCTVCTVTGNATGDATSGAGAATVDALVVVGADRNTSDIHAISRLVSEDVYHNLKLMESLASRVRRGGVIAWACARAEAGAGAGAGAFSGAEEAFDAALRASLQLAAGNAGCEAVWCGQEAAGGAGAAGGVEGAARRVAAALARTGPAQAHAAPTGFSIRNTAAKIGGCVGRWLKIP